MSFFKINYFFKAKTIIFTKKFNFIKFIQKNNKIFDNYLKKYLKSN